MKCRQCGLNLINSNLNDLSFENDNLITLSVKSR